MSEVMNEKGDESKIRDLGGKKLGTTIQGFMGSGLRDFDPPK
jgi:hypothetical protein